ncbi:hypothetical protein BYT27DRAFT_6688195 [Phlegmacium glaucopus]|nr:hypothetical protein BYT27DRAFT_6688195 [Phlegmacium glaucopus]
MATCIGGFSCLKMIVPWQSVASRSGVLIAASVITVLTIDSEESYAFRYHICPEVTSMAVSRPRRTGSLGKSRLPWYLMDEDFLSFTEQNKMLIYARYTTFPSVVQACHRVSVCPLDHILYTEFLVQGLGIYQFMGMFAVI